MQQEYAVSNPLEFEGYGKDCWGFTADALYCRADWNWARDGGATLTHGWKPESGFLPHTATKAMTRGSCSGCSASARRLTQ